MAVVPHPFLHHLTLPDEAATARLAAGLARRLRPGDTLLLEGGLGAGKSALARKIIRSRLGSDIEVPSPTYTLVQTYGADAGEIWHADLYRLSGPDEVAETGLGEALGAAICLIEWPDRLGDMTPPEALTLALAIVGDTARSATLTGPADWGDRLAGLTADG
jgi:tRNA threonylcarbamoyladenosine biosynthesis protein TsaE